MKPYAELIEHTDVTIEMVPIRGGKFLMGSPDGEKGRKADEGPQHEVEIAPFWMAKCEITWDAYEVWMSDLDIVRRRCAGLPGHAARQVRRQFQLTQPTKPYTDMTFGMGKRGYPAICMTQHACRVFCQWLSRQDGPLLPPADRGRVGICLPGRHDDGLFVRRRPGAARRLCLVSATTAARSIRRSARRSPTPGACTTCTATWPSGCLDQYTPDFYAKSKAAGLAKDPLAIPLKEYPAGRAAAARGTTTRVRCRSAARVGSTEDWKQQDPQIPQSIWYFTDALHVGFRIVRPLTEPSDEEKAAKWDKSEPPQIDKDKPKE